MLGASLQRTETPASVIKIAIDAAEKSLKKLSEHVLGKRSQKPGRTIRPDRKYYDLPTQQIAYGSLEIAFGPPPKTTQQDFVDETTEILEQMGLLLRKGLELTARQNELPKLTTSNDEEERIALEAVKDLAPSIQGAVDEVQISGRLVGTDKIPTRLTRDTRKWLNQLLSPSKQQEDHIVAEGVIREADKDRLSFTLRSLSGVHPPIADSEIVFSFEDVLLDDVMLAFEAGFRVRVVGWNFPKEGMYALAIKPMQD
jgi:hypothetical protein